MVENARAPGGVLRAYNQLRGNCRLPDSLAWYAKAVEHAGPMIN